MDAEADAIPGHISGDGSDWYSIQLAVAEGLGFRDLRIEIRVRRRSYSRCRC